MVLIFVLKLPEDSFTPPTSTEIAIKHTQHTLYLSSHCFSCLSRTLRRWQPGLCMYSDTVPQASFLLVLLLVVLLRFYVSCYHKSNEVHFEGMMVSKQAGSPQSAWLSTQKVHLHFQPSTLALWSWVRKSTGHSQVCEHIQRLIIKGILCSFF
jgi:hypothetical protein